MILQKITKPIVHNIHYKIWAFATALLWWHYIHDIYQTTVKITIPLNIENVTLNEKFLTLQVQLNKLSYYAGYHTETKFFLDKKPIHDIIIIENHMIFTHPAVRIVNFYPTVVHVKK
jgi:hypothetical protein